MSKKKLFLAASMAASMQACDQPSIPVSQGTLDQIAELHREAADSENPGAAQILETLVDERRDLLSRVGVLDDSDWRRVVGTGGSHLELNTAFRDREGNTWVLDESTLQSNHPKFRLE